MLVKNESKVTEVKLENGTVFRVGDDYGDGTIFSIEVGEEFESEIFESYMEFEDEEGNEVSAKEVKLCLNITDRGEGWSVFMTEEGKEVIEA